MEDADEETNITIKLHPLVVLNISQHFTRIRAQNLVPNESNKAPIVGGVLMGKLSARSIDIRDTFEVPLHVDGGTITSINTEYLHNKAEHLTQVSDNEVVGWYRTGSLLPRNEDETITKVMHEHKEATILLKVDPCSADRGTNELPMTLYELEANGGLLQKKFVMEAKEAERTAVEGLANDYSGSSHEYGSLLRLYSKISVLEKYLKAIMAAELPPNPDLIRQINLIIQKLPIAPDETLNQTSTETSAISCLASITQGSQLLQQLLQKMEVIHEKKGGGSRIRGLLI